MQRMRGVPVILASHNSNMQGQLASMSRSILLLFVTKLLNLHSPFFLPTAHRPFPHLIERYRGRGDGGGWGGGDSSEAW